MKTMKTMKKSLTKMALISLIVSTFTSCEMNNSNNITTNVSGIYENGYFVINEGNFGSGNGSISFVTEEGMVENSVFSSTNFLPLGDVVQSMEIINDNAYIVVNNSSKIEVASIDSMISVTTISGLSSPRYISAVSSNKAYVTDWGINGVQVIDLNTHQITGSIACGTGPEEIVISNGYAYVCNVGGWGLDNTVTVIDISNDMVVSTLSVGDKPNSVVVDRNGDVWVLSGGYTEYDANWNVVSETAGSLVQLSNNMVANSFTFAVGNHPSDLVINDEGTILYYSDGNWSKSVFAFNINHSSLSSIPFINRSFYGLGYNNGYIYGTDAVDFVQNGWSYKYSNTGNIIDSIQVEIIPGDYCFN